MTRFLSSDNSSVVYNPGADEDNALSPEFLAKVDHCETTQAPAHLLDLFIYLLPHHRDPILDHIRKLSIIDIPVDDILEPRQGLTFHVIFVSAAFLKSGLSFREDLLLLVQFAVIS
jgi:hypothetical protein